MTTFEFVPPFRHLQRAKDLADACFFDHLAVADLARAAALSPAHFSREFRRAFGEPPYAYLQTRRLERAAALLRDTDRPVAEIVSGVGLRSVSSFTRSFKRAFGLSPAAYRATFPPSANGGVVPGCAIRLRARPNLSRIGQAASSSGD